MDSLSLNDYMDYLNGKTLPVMIMEFKKEFNPNFYTNFMTNSLYEFKKLIIHSLKFTHSEYNVVNFRLLLIQSKYECITKSNKEIIKFCNNFIQHLLQELQNQHIQNDIASNIFKEFQTRLTYAFYSSKIIQYIQTYIHTYIINLNNNPSGNIIQHKIQIYNMITELVYNLQLYQEKITILYNSYIAYSSVINEKHLQRTKYYSNL